MINYCPGIELIKVNEKIAEVSGRNDMIWITILRDRSNNVHFLLARGHYGQKENSIVCAGVSALTQAALKGLIARGVDVDYSIDTDEMFVTIFKTDDATNAILETTLIGLKEIQKYYGGIDIDEGFCE